MKIVGANIKDNYNLNLPLTWVRGYFWGCPLEWLFLLFLLAIGTYLVAGAHRHALILPYPARLARSSRCFSRCPHALECALHLFIYCYNRRQLHKQLFLTDPAHIKDFLDPLL
jgi:hypothetical protein